MMMTACLTAIIRREDDIFFALCPALDVKSSGRTVESASSNLREAVERLLAQTDLREVLLTPSVERYVTGLKIDVDSISGKE